MSMNLPKHLQYDIPRNDAIHQLAELYVEYYILAEKESIPWRVFSDILEEVGALMKLWELTSIELTYAYDIARNYHYQK